LAFLRQLTSLCGTKNLSVNSIEADTWLPTG
jgi:hypothetical protein